MNMGIYSHLLRESYQYFFFKRAHFKKKCRRHDKIRKRQSRIVRDCKTYQVSQTFRTRVNWPSKQHHAWYPPNPVWPVEGDIPVIIDNDLILLTKYMYLIYASFLIHERPMINWSVTINVWQASHFFFNFL